MTARRLGWWAALLLATGCVTPAATKEASRKHGENLTSLESAVRSYQGAVADYYRKAQLQQREAYIAQMLSQEIDQVALDQFKSLPSGQPMSVRFNSPQLLAPAVQDKTSADFIEIGTLLVDSHDHWGQNFDQWFHARGATLTEKFQNAIAEKQAELEKERGTPAEGDEARAAQARRISRLSRVVELLEQQRRRPPSELTHLEAAINLDKQAQALDAKLNLLLKQIKVMQAYHGVVDMYLATDATIDGQSLANAAAAGAAVAPNDFPELKALVPGSKGGEKP